MGPEENTILGSFTSSPATSASQMRGHHSFNIIVNPDRQKPQLDLPNHCTQPIKQPASTKAGRCSSGGQREMRSSVKVYPTRWIVSARYEIALACVFELRTTQRPWKCLRKRETKFCHMSTKGCLQHVTCLMHFSHIPNCFTGTRLLAR